MHRPSAYEEPRRFRSFLRRLRDESPHDQSAPFVKNLEDCGTHEQRKQSTVPLENLEMFERMGVSFPT
jgi:hypothetical protein